MMPLANAATWGANSKKLGIALIKYAPIVLMLSACTIGPDYEKPAIDTPTAFQYVDDNEATVEMEADWWLAYNDPRLSALIERATSESPNLAAALARVDRAAATVGVARSELFPQANFYTSALRGRQSGNTNGNFGNGDTRNRYSSSLGLVWEVDVWGRVRRLSNSALAEAQAEANAYAYSLVLVQTGVAEAYFTVRITDRSISLLERTVRGRLELLELADVRQRSGLGDELELAQARTEWAAAAADLQAFRRERAIAQNALAVLVGAFPEEFVIQPDPAWEPYLPVSPSVVPSQLLERRPDVAEAERLVAAASEVIGARTAEYFPRIRITGDVGFAASDASNWFTKSSMFGTIGPSIEFPILSGGRIKSQVEQAKAEYREVTALYKQQVLDAFRQVEDALAGLKFLSREINSQGIAGNAANTAARLARQRFDSGLVSYLEVVDTERISLSTNLRLNQVKGEILAQQLALIRSLGGGWEPAADMTVEDAEALAEGTAKSEDVDK